MVRRGLVFLLENSLCLILGTVAALVWANFDHESYEDFVDGKLFGHTIHFWITDVAMSLFFLVIGKEVFENFLPGGALSSWRKAATPLIATVGGMFVPVLLFVGCCFAFGRREVMAGWAIPCATDIAFSYMVARMIFGSSHVAITFLLLVAVADDAGGLAILAVCFPKGGGSILAGLFYAGVALLGGLLLRAMRAQSFWWYMLPGASSWFAFYSSGLHPALGLVPIVCLMPHARRDLGTFAKEEDALPDTLNRMEHFFKPIVEVVLGLFALVNAGVVFSSIGAPTFFVLFALLVGKPLGIFSFGYAATALFGFELPKGMTKRDLLVVGMVAGIGFTVSLFVSVLAYPQGGAVLDAAKMGALFSFGAGGVAILAARLLGVQKHKEAEEVTEPVAQDGVPGMAEVEVV